MADKTTINKSSKDLYHRKYLLATQMLFDINMELLYKTENKSIDELKAIADTSKDYLLSVKNFINEAFSDIEVQLNNLDKKLDNLKEDNSTEKKKEISDSIFDLLKEIDALLGK